MLNPIRLPVSARHQISGGIITQSKAPQIEARTERLALTAKNNHSNTRVPCKRGERRGDTVEHGWVECIHLVGPIQTDVTHTLFGRRQNSVVHPEALYRCFRQSITTSSQGGNHLSAPSLIDVGEVR
jgi:hypothetical protein